MKSGGLDGFALAGVEPFKYLVFVFHVSYFYMQTYNNLA